MTNSFSIIEIPADAAVATEAMGTKFKFWFHHPQLGYCLYKQARPNTGEDWAEKIASELCNLLKLPHARVELATWNKTQGTVSPSFIPALGTLIHGNEILAPMVPGYPRFQTFNVSQHTLDVVLTAIGNEQVNLPWDWTAPGGIQTAVETNARLLTIRCLDWQHRSASRKLGIHRYTVTAECAVSSTHLRPCFLPGERIARR